MLSRWGLATLAAALIGLLALAPAVPAVEPLGACCFASGACQELTATQCQGQGAEFIGDDSTCEFIDCAASVAVPLLSIAGLVAALGALGALGVYRLIGRRRA